MNRNYYKAFGVSALRGRPFKNGMMLMMNVIRILCPAQSLIDSSSRDKPNHINTFSDSKR